MVALRRGRERREEVRRRNTGKEKGTYKRVVVFSVSWYWFYMIFYMRVFLRPILHKHDSELVRGRILDT